MIFVTALGEAAEGSPMEGVDGAGQQLWQPVEFGCWLPTRLALSVLVVGKSRRSWKGKHFFMQNFPDETVPGRLNKVTAGGRFFF